MVECMNEFFLEKRKEILDTFVTPSMDPIRILSKIIPKPESKFMLKELTIEGRIEMIRAMKNSTLSGLIESLPEL